MGLLGAGVAYQYHEDALLASMPLDGPQEFEVAPGTTLPQIAEKMAAGNLIDHPSFLVLYARLEKQANQLKVGHYQLNPGMSAWQAVLLFNSGKVIQRKFTIIEGWRFSELLSALQGSGTIKWTLDGVSDAGIMEYLGRPGQEPEGMFFADTYFFPDGTTDREFLKRAMLTLTQTLDKAWLGRAADLPLENAYQALILASIIEKETAVAEERARIAGVFIRRLRKGMRLQTDPTVIYGLGAKFDGNLRRRDLKADTPYNTYTRKGLPPTPIALPGAGSIAAAVHPEIDSALYFVARGDGRHYFSNSYKEHLQAVKQYQLKVRRNKTRKSAED